MEIFRGYEKQVLNFLLSDILTPDQLNELVSDSRLVGYEYTGSGYFLKVRHPFLSIGKKVIDKPIVIGQSNDTTSGFAVFIEKNELTLECHSWSGLELTENFRNEDVQVKQVLLKSGECISIETGEIISIE